ncbi:hypothetical protein Tco_1218314 [Tanacetum coccineum]
MPTRFKDRRSSKASLNEHAEQRDQAYENSQIYRGEDQKATHSKIKKSNLQCWYGSAKNHKKTVKNEQARTRESEEFKKKPKIQSRSQKSQASEVNSRALKHNGRVKEVKSIVFISSQAKEATSSMEEAQIVVGFCTKSFSKEAQVSLKRIATLAIRVRSLIDPTAKILAPMIG